MNNVGETFIGIYFILKKIRSTLYCIWYIIYDYFWALDRASIKLLIAGCTRWILANEIVICMVLGLVVKLRRLFILFHFKYALTLWYFTFDVLGILLILYILSNHFHVSKQPMRCIYYVFYWKENWSFQNISEEKYFFWRVQPSQFRMESLVSEILSRLSDINMIS